MVRLHVRRAAPAIIEEAQRLLHGLAYAELTAASLERALEPFPLPLRSLGALQLASAVYLRQQAPGLLMATYDHRMATAAEAMGLGLAAL